MARRVVKLGGSSLSKGDHAARLARWLSQQPSAQTIIVVGGGAAIDRIAARQRRDEFDDERAHWQCIDVMRHNAERLLLQSPQFERLSDLSALPAADGTAHTWVLDPRPFMDVDARSPSPLPASWDVSSDSIAARVAERCGADELVLLKSQLPPSVRRLDGYVDAFFATASRCLPAVRFVNLRDDAFAEVRRTPR